MRKTTLLCAFGTGLAFLTLAACSGAGGDSALGTETAGFDFFGQAGAIEILPGLALGADPEEVVLDPCDPDAADPDTGKLVGKTTIGAFVRDAELEPVVGVEVTFATSAGMLESMGQPVLTDDRGLATDMLTVNEDDAGDVVVTVTTSDAEEMLTVPVSLLAKPPITLEIHPAELWPPNHKLHEVTAVFGGLDCDPSTSFTLVSATSNEPDNGIGDGNTDDDIQGAELGSDDTTVLLRAERGGGGDGRVYTLTYEVTNDSDEPVMLSATVSVAHDQGH